MNEHVKPLIQHVEQCFGRAVLTARHFEMLSDSIHERTGVLLSPTTLKRLWGYLSEPVTPRLHTLDTLSRYAGWPNWSRFTEAPVASVESGPVGRTGIDVRNNLRQGDLLSLAWLPDRTCRLRYLGDESFEIIESKNTRLQPGDHFLCSLIISDEPLYLRHLTRGGADLGIYVCGRHSGIHFSFLP